MDHLEIAKALLAAGAGKHVTAQGHTPVSLAEARQAAAMIQLLFGPVQSLVPALAPPIKQLRAGP
jgi:hypothetical protein